MHQLFVGMEDGRRHSLAQRDGADRLVAGRKPLSQGDHVRLDSIRLRTEPFAGAAEAGDHFIDVDQHVVFGADALHLWPVACRREDETAGTLHRLGRERGNAIRAQLENFLFQLVRDQ